MKKQILTTTLLATLTAAGAGSVQADEPAMAQSSTPESNQSFGLNDIWTSIGAPQFMPSALTFVPRRSAHGYVYSASQNDRGFYWAQLNLPNGAEVKYIEMAVYDNDPNGWVGFAVNGVQAYAPLVDPTPETKNFGDISTGSAATPGYTTISITPADPMVIHESTDFDGDGRGMAYFFIDVATVRGALAKDDDIRFFGAAVRWARTLSPAPATASFDDVPTDYWAFQHIEALAKSGITSGCDASNFCPEDTLTRAQMAVFLAKALGLHWAW